MKKAIKYAILGAAALFMSGCVAGTNGIRVEKDEKVFKASVIDGFYHKKNR